MKTLLFTLFTTLILTVAIYAQQPRTTPTPQTADDDVVKISTSLIQIDATVTDKKGSAITDLKSEDFEIYENGQKQLITNFSFIAAPAKNQPTESNQAAKSIDKFAAPAPLVKLKPEEIRRTYAIVVDDLGLSFSSVGYVKDTLKKFVDEQMQEGDLVAIVRVGGGLGALQSFTSDKRQLLAAIGKIRWRIDGRVGLNSYESFRQDLLDQLGDDSTQPDRARMNQTNKEFAAQTEASRKSNIAVGTLGALKSIIEAMKDLPGRKSLMLFSEGFELLDYSHVGTRTNPTIAPQTTRIFDDFKNLIDSANRSSVVFYTFDPRGLDVPVVEAVDDVGANGPPNIGKFTGLELRRMQVRDTKDSLRYMSEQTGGLAYVDLNRMDIGVRKALDDQKGYYLIGYQPDEETFDAKKLKFNKLEVKIKRADLKIRYRSGFFGVTDENLKRRQTPVQQINAALTSPFGATGVNLDLYSIFFSDEKNKNFISSFVWIDAKNLKFTPQADGKHKAEIQIFATTFGDNGVPVDAIAKSYAVELDEKKYQKALEQGFVYKVLLAVKKPGAYQFRIGVRDAGSNKIGSASQFIEVPDVGKKNLTLSNLIVKNYSLLQWKKLAGGQNSDSPDGTAFLDTTVRQFKPGTVLAYSYEIYNAKIDAARQKPQLQIQTRLFRDGKMILEGKPMPLNVGAQKDLRRIEITDAVTLGTDLSAGGYILQLIVLDALAKEKKQIASQSVDFEIVK